MNIIQQPDSLSLSQNLKEFLIASDSQVSFVLRQGETELLSQRYDPPAKGYITINLRDVIHGRLTYQLKDSGSIYQQTSLVSNFTAIIDSTEVTFRVVRSGVDRLATSAINFLTQNFLTWQPNSKPVTYYSPEFLTYYAVVSCTIKLRAYFTSESGEVINQKDCNIADLAEGNAYTIPMQYANVVGLLNNEFPAYYDVWTENTDGKRLSYIQRYYATNMFSEQEQWILFENSLGGLDTFRAYGSTNFTGEHTHNIAETDELSVEYRVDTERKFKKNTGYLNKEERQWLLDFFPSKGKYIYTGTYIRPIVVTESNVEYTDRELPSNYAFTYKYADAHPLLNIPRIDSPADILQIKVPDVGSFTIPPRLAEFSPLPLSEGALFPVQNPYSEEWGTTTASAIGNFIISLLTVNGEGGGVGHKHPNIDLLNLLSFVKEYILVGGRKVKAAYADETGVARALETEDFAKGTRGASVYRDDDDNWHFESDYGHFRRKFTTEEIEVQKTSHIGGKVMQTAARMICIRVEEYSDFYRCFYQRKDPDGRTIYNQWKIKDQGLVETFNLQDPADEKTGSHFYWRLVTGISDDNADSSEGYIDLSKTLCAVDSDAPLSGDEIVQLGYQGDDDPERQNAIIQAGAGNGSPYIRLYKGINSFTLPKPKIDLNLEESVINSIVHMGPGSTGFENFSDVEFGKINLIRNSGFTGDYNSAKMEATTEVTDETELYSQAVKWWAATNVTINYEDKDSKSGRSATLTTGILMQTLYNRLMEGEKYILSFKAKGASVTVSIGGLEQIVELKPIYDCYIIRFTSKPETILAFSGSCTITEIQLECGTVASGWSMSPLDNSSSEIKFEALRYLTDVMREGSSTFIGGLGLMSMILVGNYVDGEMKKVTGGLSGVYNDDDDVLLFGGGDLEQAIKTVISCKENPTAILNMSEAELAELAKVVLTHGGRAILNDVVMRGYIYALGGLFKGTLDVANGTTHIDEDGTGWIGKLGEEYFAKWDKAMNGFFCNGNIKWDAIKKLLTVNGQINAKGGSKIGNLTIGENGALSGGNAVFEDLDIFSPLLIGSWFDEDKLAAAYKSFITDRIEKSTTIIIGGPKMKSNYYTVDLPSSEELSRKNINGGFRLTLIAVASPSLLLGAITFYSATFRVTSRPKGIFNVWGPNGPEPVEVPAGEIHDNNNNKMDYIEMAQGDILELYYYGGIYYLLNRRY